MNEQQAYCIRKSEFPRTRAGQIDLISLVGYTALRGGGPLAHCPDKQVRAVAHRLYEEAVRYTPLDEAAILLEELHAESAKSKPGYQWRTFLCERLGLEFEESDVYSLQELEEMLCG